MTDRTATTGLRAARLARGWSQVDAARELAARARARGAPVAATASLKTLLSRWENGRVLPEPLYRSLLGELYDRTPAELGIAGQAAEHAAERAATGRTRLRAAIAAAAAVERAGLDLWWEQLAVARRLDDELGVAGAGELVRAQVRQLDQTLTHTLAPAARAAVAAVLAPAAAMAGSQSLDLGQHDEAWHCYHRARGAAREADLPDELAIAVAGQAEVLVDAGEPTAAVALLEQAGPTTSRGAQIRLDAARSLARAAAGEDAEARGAMAAAEQALHRFAVDVTTPGQVPAVELADLHRWHGRTLVTLGDPAATGPLLSALAAHPQSARHRAAVHADLALALGPGRPDEAAAHARAARELAVSIGSERTIAQLSRTGNRS